MKICLVVFLIVLFIIMLLAYPFKINFKLYANLIELKCFYSIKIMFLKLLCGTTYIEDNNLIIQNTNNIVYNTQKDYKKQMINIESIVKQISVSKVELFFTGGIENNAYQTAILCGYVYALTSSLISYLITKNPMVNIFQDIDPNYNKNTLDLTIKCILEISILDIVFGLLTGKKQFKESNSGKEK